MANKIIATGSYTISTQLDGNDSFTILLSNETHSIACDFLGKPGVGEIGTASSKAKSTITAKLGNVELTAVGESEALGKGKFKYKINNTLSSSTCLGERANNNTFYLKEIYEDSGELIVDVYLESDSNKYTKQFSWSKVLDGEDARYVGLVGQSYFHYDNPQDTTSTPVEISLEGILYNQLQGTAKWQYKPSKETVWKDIVSQTGSLISGNTLTMNDKVLFGLNDPVTDIKFIVIDSVTNVEYYAIKSITKVYDGKPGTPGEDGKPGKDSYTMLLTNESHTILCDKDYVPKPGEINSTTCKAKSDIIVKKGTESLTVVGESATPTVGQWKYKIEPAPVNCTAARASNTSFYLTSISGDSGKVSVTLYVEGVAASNKFVKEFTWSRVIEGSNAPYIKLEGEQFFKYDNKDDTTPTPVEIALTVNSYNINTPSFVWQYYSGGWKAIESAPGSVIANNVLTINDKKLFGSNNSVRIRCYTTNLGETINDTVTIAKVYDGSDGNDGAPGDPSKTVKITGKNSIKYTNGSANPTSIVLTATPTNYKTKAFKWYKLSGSSFTQITTGINTTGNQLTVTASTMADTELYKVECRETNGNDLSFDEFQITKVYDGVDGGDGNSYVVNITEGTRNICYNGKNNLVSTQITPFKLEVFKNNVDVVGTVAIKSITWSAKGHYTTPAASGNTSFQPTPIATYDESKLDTAVSVVVNCEGRIIKASVPVTVSKNSTAIDWVEEWDNSKVEIGGEYIISPKIFAGKKNTQSNTITGIALGRDIINNSDEVGLAIYSDNNVIGKILSTPTSDGKMVIFGGESGSQVYINTDGSVCIEGGITVGSKTLIKVVEDAEKGSQANDKIDNLEIGGRNLLRNSNKFGLSLYMGATLTSSEEVTVEEWGNKKATKLVISGGTNGVKATKASGDGRKWAKDVNYTASIWARNDGEYDITISGNSIGIETIKPGESKRVVLSGVGNGTSFMQFNFSIPSQYDVMKITLAESQIETGTRVSDWTPAPEDADEAIGNNITSVDVMYYLSTSSTSLAGGSWSTKAPNWIDGKYMWSKTVTVLANGDRRESEPTCIAGAKGSSGSDGVGIKTIVEQYYKSTSNTSLAGGSWTEIVPSWEKGKYVWTRSVITYTNNTTKTTDPVCSTGYHGQDGSNGKDGTNGVSVLSIDVEYAQNTSTTTAPTSGWETTAPAWKNGYYTWSRTVSKLSNGTTNISKEVCITGGKGSNGSNGATGATGQGVESITEEYYLSTSKTSQSGGSWVTKAPTWSTGKYMWTRSKIVYKNPTSTSYTTPVCDSSWEAVNEVEVGGRNFLINSTFIENDTYEDILWDQELNGTYIATNWGFYNGGVSNPTTGYHAHLFLLNGELVVRYMEQVDRWQSATYHVPDTVKSNFDKGTTYTYSFEIYSDTVGSRLYGGFYYTQIGGTNASFHNGQYGFTVKEANKWIRYSYTFKMPEDMDLTKSVNIYNYGEESKGTTYARRFMLEKGNKAGDHKEAPEDVDSKVDDQILGVHDLIATMKAENVIATEKLLEDELIKYLKTGEFNEFYELYSTRLKNDNDSFDFLFNKVNVEIKESLDGLTGTTTEIQKYISFVDGDIVLGNTESPFTMKITNEKIQFLDGGNEIAYISNQKLFITDAEITNSLQIGSFKWIPRANGNLSFTWVGGS